MYDIFYPKVNGQYVPYVSDDNLSVSAVYQIPKEEFESVIMKYFNIDSETLQSKTVYCSENSTYEYKPRGFEEVEYPEYPYSEVVGFTENSDGTITLSVAGETFVESLQEYLQSISLIICIRQWMELRYLQKG